MRVDQTTSEEKLLELIQQHAPEEQQAYEELYHRYSKLIKFIANQTLANDADAEDVLQETFVEIQRSIASLRNPKYFRLWVYRIVHSKCSNVFRKKKFTYVDVDGEYIQNMVPDERKDRDPHKQMRFQSDQEMMQEFLSQLPAGQSIVLQMFYMEQFSIKEIASALELPEGTVKSRMSVAKKALKDKIDRYEATYGLKVSFRSLDAGLMLAYAGLGFLPKTASYKGSKKNSSTLQSALTSKLAIVSLCGVCAISGGAMAYKAYQGYTANKHTSLPANAPLPQNAFREVQMEDRKVTNAKAAYFYLLEHACCEDEINDMEQAELLQLQPLYVSLKEMNGYHYQLLESSGWNAAYEEKLK